MDFLENKNLVRNVTIASGTSQSNVVNLRGASLLAIEMPSAWSAADITFLAANLPDGSFLPVYDDAGTEVKIKAAASQMISLDSVALKLAPFQYIKLRSGTAASAVNQTAERKLKIIGKA